MIHLIGLNHDAQSRRLGESLAGDQSTFVCCLNKAIAEIRPSLVAEEDSEEALSKRCRASLSKPIATMCGIEHRFCDPPEEQRQKLGYKDQVDIKRELCMTTCADLAPYEVFGLPSNEIESMAIAIMIGKYFPLREQFWLNTLKEVVDSEVLFICGDLHVESFGDLLVANNVAYRIVERGIGVTKQNDAFYEGRNYLVEHPDIVNWYETRVLNEA